MTGAPTGPAASKLAAALAPVATEAWEAAVSVERLAVAMEEFDTALRAHLAERQAVVASWGMPGPRANPFLRLFQDATKAAAAAQRRYERHHRPGAKRPRRARVVRVRT